MQYAVDCYSCSHRRFYENQAEAEHSEFDMCPKCGEDAGRAISLEPCPNGVTDADWLNSKRGATTGLVERCGSDDHEYKTGMHVVELSE